MGAPNPDADGHWGRLKSRFAPLQIGKVCVSFETWKKRDEDTKVVPRGKIC